MKNDEIIDAVRSKQFLLVIDPNARDAGVTALLLQKFGYRVVTLQTVRQAQEIISIALPALVVTELLLHEVTGLELVGQLKGDHRTSSIPIVVLTRVHDRQSEARCRAAGCTAYLRKPATAEQFYQIVQAAIEPTPRQNIRLGIRFPVTVAWPDAPPSRAMATDLSADGMFLRTTSVYPPGTRVSLAFQLRGRAMVMDAEVLYRKDEDAEDADGPGLGVRFPNPGERDRDWIGRTINDSMKSGLDDEGEGKSGSDQS